GGTAAVLSARNPRAPIVRTIERARTREGRPASTCRRTPNHVAIRPRPRTRTEPGITSLDTPDPSSIRAAEMTQPSCRARARRLVLLKVTLWQRMRQVNRNFIAIGSYSSPEEAAGSFVALRFEEPAPDRMDTPPRRLGNGLADDPCRFAGNDQRHCR